MWKIEKNNRTNKNGKIKKSFKKVKFVRLEMRISFLIVIAADDLTEKAWFRLVTYCVTSYSSLQSLVSRAGLDFVMQSRREFCIRVRGHGSVSWEMCWISAKPSMFTFFKQHFSGYYRYSMHYERLVEWFILCTCCMAKMEKNSCQIMRIFIWRNFSTKWYGWLCL